MCILQNVVSFSFNPSGINVGLAVGLSLGLLTVILFIATLLCLFLSGRANRPVQTRVVATNTSTRTTTVVTSNQTGTTTAAPVPYPQEPEYKDTQFISQGAPPSYSDVTALPPAAQVANSI